MDRSTRFCAVTLIAFATLGLSGCDRFSTETETTKYRPNRGQIERACTSQTIATLVKDKVFTTAIERSKDNKDALDSLRQGLTGRIEKALFQGHDPSMRRTECAGKLVLNLPPNVQRAFEKKDFLVADVTFGVQPSKEGAVVDVAGADAIISALVEAAVKKIIILPPPPVRVPRYEDPPLPEFRDEDFEELPYIPPVDDGFDVPRVDRIPESEDSVPAPPPDEGERADLPEETLPEF
jgi:hypothetical protein